ncbi:MAG: TetR family transcriptional regulator [Kofleriaceae bacterium]|jgi:AcrR family transcriptional regulator|nr:TetR family transcriptional regulator [Kofleriaceae bacterium]MBP9166191.1 TetR family transcriptional regulator [Kofleriaceae bacterium]MBP9857021.1 TetR family transcriptional regulator [Kofleriaceae bacterium]
MSSGPTFQRARDPDQKEQRRTDVLAAARRLVTAEGVAAVGLSAIAREVGLAKSNLYRYFGSREEILLELLTEEVAAWLDEFEAAAAPLVGSDDVDRVAQTLAHTVAARPIACALIAVVAGVLEHNTSVPAAELFKSRMLALAVRLRAALTTALPALPFFRAAAVVRYLHAQIAGLWPMANPPPLMREIVARPAYADLACDFEADLRGSVRAMLRGLTIPIRYPTGSE